MHGWHASDLTLNRILSLSSYETFEGFVLCCEYVYAVAGVRLETQGVFGPQFGWCWWWCEQRGLKKVAGAVSRSPHV